MTGDYADLGSTVGSSLRTNGLRSGRGQTRGSAWLCRSARWLRPLFRFLNALLTKALNAREMDWALPYGNHPLYLSLWKGYDNFSLKSKDLGWCSARLKRSLELSNSLNRDLRRSWLILLRSKVPSISSYQNGSTAIYSNEVRFYKFYKLLLCSRK